MAKQRIAVLGGGVGALSAAFYLTEQSGWADKYEITVYQQGWRLGGKCASGHDMREGYGHRIYEHGLHIFAGFYYQAFDLLRRAYKALDRPEGHPNRDVWDAFTPEDAVALIDLSKDASADRIWYLDFPPNYEVPGDDLSMPTVGDSLRALVMQLLRVSPAGPPASVVPAAPLSPAAGSSSSSAKAPLLAVCDLLKGLFEKIEGDVKQEVTEIEYEWVLDSAIRLMEAHAKSMIGQVDIVTDGLTIDRLLLSIYLVQTIVHGVIVDRVIDKGYDSLDVYELSEWLYNNALIVAQRFPEWGDPQARATALIEWTPIKSAYDYVFGYGDGGDESKRTFAAGTALRSFLLLAIGYKGHFFWKMKGAMGDVVIAPLYLALRKRGVMFQFFSRITAVNPHATEDCIESVDYVEQVQLKDAPVHYAPLIDIALPGWPKNMPLEGWPAEPLWDQICDGENLKAKGRDLEADTNDMPGAGDMRGRLVRGKDFDQIILGISVGGLKQVCSSFPARLPKSNWGPMFGALTLTRTCAMQLWFKRTIDDLGCKGPDRTLAGAEQPYSAWSDMSHLLSRETWNGVERPLSIAYFCGQLPGPEDGGAANEKALKEADKWLRSNAELYWPRASAPGNHYGIDTELLFDPEPLAGGNPLTRQYVRANTNPSDLYVQSPKNSVYTRMDADQSGFSNLFLAGDWTLNGLNAGAAEAAAKSGARCALAIVGKLPPLAG
ncbi:MAG: NAD(P)-binding protein [Rhizomicrobium sp.]